MRDLFSLIEQTGSEMQEYSLLQRFGDAPLFLQQ